MANSDSMARDPHRMNDEAADSPEDAESWWLQFSGRTARRGRARWLVEIGAAVTQTIGRCALSVGIHCYFQFLAHLNVRLVTFKTGIEDIEVAEANQETASDPVYRVALSDHVGVVTIRLQFG